VGEVGEVIAKLMKKKNGFTNFEGILWHHGILRVNSVLNTCVVEGYRDESATQKKYLRDVFAKGTLLGGTCECISLLCSGFAPHNVCR